MQCLHLNWMINVKQLKNKILVFKETCSWLAPWLDGYKIQSVYGKH